MARECKINDGGGRGVENGENRQQLMLDSFTIKGRIKRCGKFYKGGLKHPGKFYTDGIKLPW